MSPARESRGGSGLLRHLASLPRRMLVIHGDAPRWLSRQDGFLAQHLSNEEIARSSEDSSYNIVSKAVKAPHLYLNLDCIGTNDRQALIPRGGIESRLLRRSEILVNSAKTLR